jgi:hypothetical protein
MTAGLNRRQILIPLFVVWATRCQFLTHQSLR